MKKFMLVVALVAATLSANAQFSLKPMVGMTISNITDVEENSVKVGLAAGVEAQYQISPVVAISGGLLYSMQGCTYDDHTIVVAGTETGYKNRSTELDYINIPILANFYVVKGLALKVGIQPGFLVNAKEKGTSVLLSYEQDYDNDIKDNCETFDFSIPIGASYEFSDFVIDARYNWGLTKINKNGDNSSKNSVFMVSFGYRFDL